MGAGEQLEIKGATPAKEREVGGGIIELSGKCTKGVTGDNSNLKEEGSVSNFNVFALIAHSAFHIFKILIN